MAWAKLPDSHFSCGFCGTPQRQGTSVCSRCGLHPSPNPVSPQRGSRGRAPRKHAPTPVSAPTPLGRPVLAVDPGARYVGVVVRDGDALLHASTLVRPKPLSGAEWAIAVVGELKGLVASHADMPIGVEDLSDPKGFKGGRGAALNPAHVVRAGMVVGAIVATWPSAVIVPPKGHGSKPADTYPAALTGRRPKDLPGSGVGAGTRNHERSAWDIAAAAAAVLWPHEPISA